MITPFTFFPTKAILVHTTQKAISPGSVLQGIGQETGRSPMKYRSLMVKGVEKKIERRKEPPNEGVEFSLHLFVTRANRRGGNRVQHQVGTLFEGF